MSERPAGIDTRGPRFAASVTAMLLLVDVLLALTGTSTLRGVTPAASAGQRSDYWAVSAATVAERAADPALLLLLAIAALFLWSLLSPRTAPWAVLFRTVVRPRLRPPFELEDPRPPRFAQGVGLLVALMGIVLHLAGVPWALPIAAAMAFVAAFLNSAFGVCLGCMLYLLLQRAGITGRERSIAA